MPAEVRADANLTQAAPWPYHKPGPGLKLLFGALAISRGPASTYHIYVCPT